MNYTREQLEIAHTTLKQLIQLAVAGKVPHPTLGICANWMWGEDLGRKDEPQCWHTYTLVSKLSQTWPHTSGCTICPIPDTEHHPMWEGHLLVLRLSLMSHMLECLDDMMRQAQS